ncbi:hypothetical protein [Acinetobacter bereziniae]|nr:hypothetical protein [Acinetobacter bereziniae]MDV8155213.1 hypothetical protein [Acinetobacter bereziniae]
MSATEATHRVRTHLGWAPAKKIKGKWHVYVFNKWKEYINQNAEFILL